MENTKTDLTKKIQNNLKFIITISVFFLGVFSDLKSEGCVLIVLYILTYIVFEVREKSFSEKNLHHIANMLLVGVGSYVIPLFITALSTQDFVLKNWETVIWKTLLGLSAYIIVFIPVIILSMVSLYSITKKTKPE